ncbi:hypothetical protein GOODEAATRI_022685 [Goodea atripinnis]|uniref:Uncharacterized protein n=1 Tax=Goodea atripinnis TaxID=208336 RepID=A0ABV0NWW4_9TELE
MRFFNFCFAISILEAMRLLTLTAADVLSFGLSEVLNFLKAIDSHSCVDISINILFSACSVLSCSCELTNQHLLGHHSPRKHCVNVFLLGCLQMHLVALLGAALGLRMLLYLLKVN